MTRPRLLVVVAGTATEVGKTWVGAALARDLVGAGLVVAARKPVQSAAPGGDRDLPSLDSDVLAAATGEPVDAVCPPHRTLRVPLAPPMAAEVLGVDPWTVDDLAAEVGASWPDPAADVGLVELAGGPASPVAADGDGVALARLVAPDLVVLVADPALGAINAVRLSVGVLATVAPVVVVLNRFEPADDLHRRNRAWLAERDGLDVVVGPSALAARWAGGVLRCDGCGRPVSACGGCRQALEPPRFCATCGRRLAVAVHPTGWSARCREHGPVGPPGP